MIQGHFNTVGIVAKHAKTLSWGTWEDLRKILGFEFEPPEDETYCTEGDIGKYYRLELPNGVKMPMLPSKYKIKKQEDGHRQQPGWLHQGKARRRICG